MSPTLAGINDFLNSYNVTILRTEPRYVNPIMMSYLSEMGQLNQSRVPCLPENLITLSIPEKDLETLMTMHALFFNNGASSELSHATFSKWAARTIEEKRLQETHESVKLAYEQYQILLRLALGE